MTNTPDNDRHERALEKAAEVGDIDWVSALFGSHFTSAPRAIEAFIVSYLSEMDAVIVPREPTDAMVEAGAVARIRAIRPTVETYSAMLSAAPHHFNQEGK